MIKYTILCGSRRPAVNVQITFIHNAVPYVLSSSKYWAVEAFVHQQIELLNRYFRWIFSGCREASQHGLIIDYRLNSWQFSVKYEVIQIMQIALCEISVAEN